MIIFLNELNRNSDSDKLGTTMSLGKGKGIFTFDFYKFIYTVNVYLLHLYDLAFFSTFFIKVMARVKANEIFFMQY